MKQPKLVIFDVDGTLHDTFQWWAPLIRSGLTQFAEANGIEVELPSDDLANGVVGMKDEGVWGPFLPPAERHRWPELRETVVPMEVEELTAGKDFLFPGVKDLLRHLRSVGVRSAIASNCRSGYFDAVKRGQGLGALTDWQFCLDSNGGCDKTEMLRLAMAAANTEQAVMVGDREPDLEAARAAGIPFVWRVNPRCDLTEASDAVWSGSPSELLGTLGLSGISSPVGE